MSAPQRQVFLVRLEVDTALTREEVMDGLCWYLDVPPYDIGDAAAPCDVSDLDYRLAVDVTPPNGID
jgi:hypothetical protein